MKILFLCWGNISQGPHGLTSSLASARYRALAPADQLARLGHSVQLGLKPATGWNVQLAQQLDADIAVFSKVSADHSDAQFALALKARGIRIAADFCDDHFEHAQLGPAYHAMAELADVIVASTDMMSASVRAHSGKSAHIVAEAYEGERSTPEFKPSFPALRLAWFGHVLNLQTVIDQKAELIALSMAMPVEIKLVTALAEVPTSQAETLNQLGGERLRVQWINWGVEAAIAALKSCDAVWIPTSPGARMQSKSANRLVESLWAGRLAVTGPLPSYEPFAQHAYVGVPLADAIQDALADTTAAERRIAGGQRLVSRLHSPFKIGRDWARALGAANPPLRLNLGCGDKILPGYVNVDVAEVRAGKRPDVLCDLHDLAPFADATADEILSVHVIEHFWRWDVESVLREWMRVLRPGGRLILECPNLQSACEEFLAAPDVAAQPDKAGQRTMWVFYGDPAWKDPLMTHRWGYTPHSLGQVLTQVGFVNVRQEPAQFKLREPRDMRMVCEKP